MDIRKIEIKNYRGFEELTINFDKHVNILVGVNGSGKTSVLDLIASFLQSFLVQLSDNSGVVTLTQSTNQRNVFDINTKAEETTNHIYVNVQSDNKPDVGSIISWGLKWNYNLISPDFSFKKDDYIHTYQKKLENNPKQSIPIFKYFYSQRNSSNKPVQNQRRQFREQFRAYEDVFNGTFEFKHFLTWFIEEENKENRAKVHLYDLEYTSPKLNAVRKAIILFLRKFPTVKYDKLKVAEYLSDPLMNIQSSSLVIDKNGETFNLIQLSDGEKNLILMIADIAHRLALANPDSEDCLKGKGIILIDEIDLHLHPAWQREIMPCLESTFPNLQFIVTTHSPQVLGNVKPENIIIIEDFKLVEFTPHTFGNDANTILWDIFGVKERPKHTQDKLDKLYELIEEEGKQEEAKQLLEELKAQLGEGNSEFVKAKLHYDFQNDLD